MRRATTLVWSFVLSGLAACVPITADKVDREVKRAVHVGMPAGDAFAALKAIGFSCPSFNNDETSPERDCRRDGGSGFILSACVQRFLLVVDDRKHVVRRVSRSTVACAGL